MAFSPACFIVFEPKGDMMNSGGWLIYGAATLTDKFFGERCRLGGGERDF